MIRLYVDSRVVRILLSSRGSIVCIYIVWVQLSLRARERGTTKRANLNEGSYVRREFFNAVRGKRVLLLLMMMGKLKSFRRCFRDRCCAL